MRENCSWKKTLDKALRHGCPTYLYLIAKYSFNCQLRMFKITLSDQMCPWNREKRTAFCVSARPEHYCQEILPPTVNPSFDTASVNALVVCMRHSIRRFFSSGNDATVGCLLQLSGKRLQRRTIPRQVCIFQLGLIPRRQPPPFWSHNRLVLLAIGTIPSASMP